MYNCVIQQRRSWGEVENVDHIGIAVRNLDEQITYYTDVLGLPLLKIEEVVTEQVRVAFIDAGNTHIELLEPMSEESAIFKFIEKEAKVFTTLL